jgi:Mg2+-importing ATPase
MFGFLRKTARSLLASLCALHPGHHPMPHKERPHPRWSWFDRFRRHGRERHISAPAVYWSVAQDKLLLALHSDHDGLSALAAVRRLRRFGTNTVGETARPSALRLLLRQFTSPLIVILIAAAVIAAYLKDWTNSIIILLIVIGSGVLSFAQEYRASRAVEKLRAQIRITCRVLRGARTETIPSRNVVPGDIVLLSAGNLVPADGVLLEAKDFFVSQAALTGESFPAEKIPGIAAADASLAERTNCVFMGTSVRSGTARMLVTQTGMHTVFGGIAERLRRRPPETEFERGIRHYGYLLMRVMLVMALAVFAANIFLQRPPVDSLLFAIALAVGMSPELLPAIVTITLAQGARQMAAHGVIVRRLSSIENLGSMDILCTDKTGTLTEGDLSLDAALDIDGKPSADALQAACLNASVQTGLANPLDQAIVANAKHASIELARYHKLDEVPYDFKRKRLSVLVQGPGFADGPMLITKGALDEVLEACDRVRRDSEVLALDQARREQITRLFAQYSQQGHRVLGIAWRPMPHKSACTRDDEHSLIFVGFLMFLDPPKQDIQRTLADLASLGIQVKVITGDNPLVAAHVAEVVGMKAPRVVTGRELIELRDEALWHVAERTDVFAEIDPNQKERIVRALQRLGYVAGYLGDGINDAPALHAADVGISVNQAVDVAKEAADFVLLEHDLDVLRRGVEQGRKTFANTFKYIAITTSANFGNMISMAAASLVLPFLPLLAKQILLNNFLSDIPAMAIAGDNVDRELIQSPRRWDIASLRKFMVIFGSISSLFDFVTFAILLWAFHATAQLFRTGWFVESLMTELVIILVIRTYRPFYRSRPGRLLWISIAVMMAVTVALPYQPGLEIFGFVALPPPVMTALMLITLLYVGASEFGKRFVYRTGHIHN